MQIPNYIRHLCPAALPLVAPLLIISGNKMTAALEMHSTHKECKGSIEEIIACCKRKPKPHSKQQETSSSDKLSGSSQVAQAPLERAEGKMPVAQKRCQAITKAMEQFAKVRQEDANKSFTLRLLIGAQVDEQDKQHVTPLHAYSHLTIGYLGKVERQTLAALVQQLEDEDLKEPAEEHLKITALRRSGPKNTLYAFEVQPGVATQKLISQLWTKYGVLEPWQVQQGIVKQSLPNLLHITLGKIDALAQKGFTTAVLQSWIGTELTLQEARIDIKPLGPYDPIYSKALSNVMHPKI